MLQNAAHVPVDALVTTDRLEVLPEELVLHVKGAADR